MILVDTSIWVDHLRSGNPTLARLLHDGAVLTHPWVIGELALGNMGQHRVEVLGLLSGLPRAAVARDEEVLGLIDHEGLAGAGIGYVDAQLLAAARLTPEARVWTTDRRLAQVSTRLAIGVRPDPGKP